MKAVSLFSGIGGFEIGLQASLDIEPILFCDIEKANQRLLRYRYKDVDIVDDVKKISKSSMNIEFDLLCGGFPCQNISKANSKTRTGLNSKKSGLWFEMLRVIDEYRPRIVVIENVANIINICLKEVIIGLYDIDYDIEWVTISAEQVGANHQRNRWFGVAYKRINKKLEYKFDSDIHIKNYWKDAWNKEKYISTIDMSDEDRLKKMKRVEQLGNAIVPACSELIGSYIRNSFLYETDNYVFPGKKDLYVSVKNDDLITNQIGLFSDFEIYENNLPKNGKLINGRLYESDKIKAQENAQEREMFWTPLKKDGGNLSSYKLCLDEDGHDSLLGQMMFRYGLSEAEKIEKKYMLNPNFIEYMMGFPIDWTRNEN